MSSAAAPDTTAAAWEVPLPRKKRSPTRALGCCRSALEPAARKLTNDLPGATRSTWRLSLPQAEKGATASSAVSRVPLVSAAPTAMTKGS